MIFLGIDLGASALKTVLVRQDGEMLAHAAMPITTQHDQAGWSEQNPQDWLTALENALAALWQDNTMTPAQIDAICLTAGAHIGVLGDENHTPVRPAIMWSDQRAASEIAEMAHQSEAIIKTSLHQPNPTWTLAHLRWLWVHEYDTLKKTRHLSPAKDWLRYQLTGDWATDPSDAVGLQLYDVDMRSWSLPLCALAGIIPDILPPIKKPESLGGTITKQAAKKFHLHPDIPVYIGSIDTSIELLNTGMNQADEACLKLASAGVLSAYTPNAEAIPPISCYPQSGEGWYFASGMNSCHSALKWMQHNRLNQCSQAQMQEWAQAAPTGANGVLFHPYIQGERAPHWHAGLRVNISGTTENTPAEDLARAAYEGVGLALYDVRLDFEQKLSAIRKQKINQLIAIGGGARDAIWMQIISDIQGLPIKVPHHIDAAYGAALFAGLSHRAYPNFSVLTNMIAYQTHYEPNMDNHLIYQGRFAAYDEIRAHMMAQLQ